MNRYDDSARLVFHYAREEGNRLGHATVDPEHLLLGLIRNGGGVADLLAQYGLTLEAARDRLEQIVGRGKGPLLNAPPTITPRARRVMELASGEARSLGADSATAVHILLGLLREGDGVAYRILEQTAGGDVDRVRWRILEAQDVGRREAPVSEAAPAAPALARLLDLILTVEGANFVLPEGVRPARFVSDVKYFLSEDIGAAVLARAFRVWIENGTLKGEQLEQTLRDALKS